LAWLGEHDAFVDLAFDTLEQTFWALKALIYQSCAEEHNNLPGDITEDMLEIFHWLGYMQIRTRLYI
jgi:hypothetical protein